MRVNFGVWLKQEREKQGLSQSALGARAELNRAIINKLENDPAIQPTAETLIAIARGLELPRSIVFAAIGWLEENDSSERLDEASYILSMLGENDLDEIIQIARLKLERQKSNIQQTSRSKRPARSALKAE
jgi:transcriptional regulator with XRE-family HTH domain